MACSNGLCTRRSNGSTSRSGYSCRSYASRSIQSNSYGYGLASNCRSLISSYSNTSSRYRSYSYSVSSTSIALSRSVIILSVGLQLVVGVNEDSLDLIVAGLYFVEDSCVSVVIAEGLGVSNNGIVVRLLLVVGVNANLNGVRSQSPSIILTVDNLTINANLVGGGDDALILNSLNLNYCETSSTGSRLNLNVRVVSLSIGSDDRVLNKVATVCRAGRTVNVQGNFLRAVPDGQLNNSVVAELGVDAVGNVTVSGRIRATGREAAGLNCQSYDLVVVNDVLCSMMLL